MKNNKIVMLFLYPSNELMDSYLRKVIELSDYEKIA